jgi:hypothetical protein
MKGLEAPVLLGPFERANLSHWARPETLSSLEYRTMAEGLEAPVLLGPFERANLSHWERPETLSSLEYRTMVEVQKLGNLECYTP